MIKKISFFLYLSFYCLFVFAQENGKPLMQIYSSNEYHGHSQNWSIIEDKRGVIYTGNQDGAILEFDGTNWRNIPITNFSSIRSLAIDNNGTIYAGGVNEFGYLTPDSQGNLHYNSLISLLDSTNREFGDIWSLNILGNKKFFQSRRTLFLYENDSIKHWHLPEMYHRSFVIQNNYYLRQEGIGLTIFEKDTFLLVSDGSVFSNELISAMIPFSDTEILIGTRTKGLYLLDKKKNEIKPFITGINEFISNSWIYHGVKIGNDKFAFATLKNGIIIIDKSGKLVQIINKNNGLPSNRTYFIHNQNNESLWIGMHPNIARIDIGYQMEYWDEQYGLDGIIYDIEKINDILYIGTTQNLYYWETDIKDNIKSGKFKRVEGITGIIWELIKYKIPCNNGANKQYKLIAATQNGMYEVAGSQATLISKPMWCLEIYCPKQNPYIIFIGGNEGLYQIQYNCISNTWMPIEKLITLKDEIRSITEDLDHSLWLSSMYLGYYRISFNHIYKDNLSSNYSFKEPYKVKNFFSNIKYMVTKDISVYNINDKLVFLTNSGLFRFNKETEQFYPDTQINKQLSDLEILWLTEDHKGNVLIDGEELFIKQADNSYINNSKRLKRIEPIDLKTAFHEEDGTTWIGFENLYKINTNDTINVNRKYHTIIRKITINKDSLIFGGTYFNDSNVVHLKQTGNFKPVLSYQFNSITFKFSSPYYIEQERIQYQFMLEGYEKSWSAWATEAKKEYTNLDEGKYVFKVKSKNIFELESSVATYEFTIEPPRHRTILAYLSYIILSGFLIILIVRFYTNRLKKANIQLENIVKKRTVEIQEKNEELTKLSFVASETDNAIVIMDDKGNYEWFNDAYVKIFGYEYDEYIKEVGSNILTISTNANIKTLIESCIKKKESVIYESEGLSKSGEKFWTQVTLSPILSKNGDIIKLISIEADIRKLKEYEEILIQKNEEIISQRDALAESNATKDKFFSIISHDLKSPFNAILGFAEMLDENIAILSKEKIAKFNNQIFTSAKQLYSLIENLLSWSRTKSGKIISYPEVLDMQNLIDNTCSIMQISAEKKEIKIYQEISPETFAFADENLISTIVRNLLSNAIKYSRENSIITIKAINKSDIVEVSVIDSGLGISQENIGKLFRENIHFTTQGTNQEKGTGLGLILCQDFARKCGGEIWVDSEEGIGTTFSFSLPKPTE